MDTKALVNMGKEHATPQSIVEAKGVNDKIKERMLYKILQVLGRTLLTKQLAWCNF